MDSVHYIMITTTYTTIIFSILCILTKLQSYNQNTIIDEYSLKYLKHLYYLYVFKY